MRVITPEDAPAVDIPPGPVVTQTAPIPPVVRA